MKAHYVFVGKCPYEIRNINYKPIKMQIIIACDDTYLHSQNLEGRGRGITLSFRVRPHLKKKTQKAKTPRERYSLQSVGYSSVPWWEEPWASLLE